MKRVLVTGASGFLGRRTLTPLMARGFEVHAVSRDRQLSKADGVTWHQFDFLRETEVSNLIDNVAPTHLLHLAWNAEPGKFWESDDNLAWQTSTQQLVNAFAKSGGRRVVGAGTGAEYEWTNVTVCDEAKSSTNPSSLYGRTKLETGRTLHEAASRLGFTSAWGRLFFIYGPGGHPDRMPAVIIRSLLNRQPAQCSSSTQARDYIYVDDAAAAFAALLDSDVEGPVNIASGETVRIIDIVQSVAQSLNGADLLRIGAVPDATDSPDSVCAKVNRLRDEVGFVPETSLESGLAKTIEWWQQTDGSKVAA